MTAILGIDAAWTAAEPSGIALVELTQGGWQSIAIAPSYNAFIMLSENKRIDWNENPIKGSPPDMASLLSAAMKISGKKIHIIAIDMPISLVPFKTRRVADNKISKEFGSRWCSAHSPNSDRPGELGRSVSTSLIESGFKLAVENSVNNESPYLLEVYPHVGLLSLLQRKKRVPYKISKSKKYWPNADIEQRKKNLLFQFQAICAGLTSVFGKLDLVLPEPNDFRTLSFLKRYEDTLDALICAWVGVQFIANKTIPLGDSTAAIWCPRDVVDFDKKAL
jgi:predicted RNase H-like nuclease